MSRVLPLNQTVLVCDLAVKNDNCSLLRAGARQIPAYVDVLATGDYSMDASEAMAMVGGHEMQAW